MKKILVFLMVLLAICSSLFAKEKTAETPKLTVKERLLVAEAMTAMIDSKLDLKRWEFVTATIEKDYYFIDRETIATPYSDILEVWECHFRQAGKGSCGFSYCKSLKIDTEKHYHYTRFKFDLSRLKCSVTSLRITDKDGKSVFSYDMPSYKQTEADVFPESLAERTMRIAKQIVQDKKKKKKK